MGHRPLSKWVRRRCIGRGSFGEVSLAVDQSSGAIFAVKSVNLDGSKQALLSLENEIQILKTIKFPWIVSYLGDDTTVEFPSGARRNLLIEYVGGGTAADRQRDEIAARSYTRCLTRSLEYLHRNGIVHGDVKGRNLLLCSSWGEAKLADFGCSRRVESSAGREMWGGSPMWMAPEVVNGGASTPAADVWSLGCTVIEMITGKVPWKVGEFEDASHVLLRIGLGDQVPEFPEELSSLGKDFLGKCLRRIPEERMTCEELLRHPFLCEMSPRGVSDWGNFGFSAEEEEEEEVEEEEEKKRLEFSCADIKERFGELGSSEGDLGWEDEEDWEVVRPACSSLPEEEEIEEEREEEDGSELGSCPDRIQRELRQATSLPRHVVLRRGEDAIIRGRHSRPLLFLSLQWPPELLFILLFGRSDCVCNRIRGLRPITAQINGPNNRPSSFELLTRKIIMVKQWTTAVIKSDMIGGPERVGGLDPVTITWGPQFD